MSKVSDRRQIASNQVFNINFFSVADDYGNSVPDYLIVEPKEIDQEFLGGVAILPVCDGKIGLVEMFRPAIERTCLEIPHGFLKAGESPEEACLRELREETGLIGSTESLFDLGLVAPDSGIIRGIVQLFLADSVSLKVEQEAEFGLGRLKFFTPAEIGGLIKEKKLIDSFTLVAYFRSIIEGHLEVDGRFLF